jgi:hypothetical protein
MYRLYGIPDLTLQGMYPLALLDPHNRELRIILKSKFSEASEIPFT